MVEFAKLALLIFWLFMALAVAYVVASLPISRLAVAGNIVLISLILFLITRVLDINGRRARGKRS